MALKLVSVITCDIDYHALGWYLVCQQSQSMTQYGSHIKENMEHT